MPPRLLLYDILLAYAGFALHLLGTLALVLMALTSGSAATSAPVRVLVAGGSLILVASLLPALDLLVLLPKKRQRHDVIWIRPPCDSCRCC